MAYGRSFILCHYDRLELRPCSLGYLLKVLCGVNTGRERNEEGLLA